MRRFTGFEHGMGIGGWLANYKRFNVLPQNRRLMLTIGDMEHFASYITEEDVAYIAKLGMDHIRLGFDQIVVEEVRDVDPVKWNQLAQKTINAIRQQNPDRKLIIGSTCWNSVHAG